MGINDKNETVFAYVGKYGPVLQFVDADDELLLNYSLNLYAGYPMYTAEYFDSFDEISPILGLSVGTPLGIKAGLAYLTLNFEFINYKFTRTNEIEGEGAQLREHI